MMAEKEEIFGPSKILVLWDERLRRLVMTDPVVHQCFHMYLYGGLSWEQALVEMVVALAEQKNKVGAMLDRALCTMPDPNVILEKKP